MNQPREPLPKFNVPGIVSSLCVALGLLFGIIAMTPIQPVDQPSIVLDPFEPGSKHEYQKATDKPLTNLSPGVNRHQVTVKNNELIIAPESPRGRERSIQSPNPNAPTFNIIHANDQGIAVERFGSLSLTGIALDNHPVQNQTPSRSDQTSPSFYDFNGVPLNNTPVLASFPEYAIKSPDTDGLFPAIHLRFLGQFPLKAKLGSIRVFHQQTFREVAQLRKVQGEMNGTFDAVLDLHCWHQVPLLIVVEFQEQLTPATTFPLLKGETYQYNQSRIRFLTHAPGSGKRITRTQRSWSPFSPELGMTLRYILQESEQPATESKYVFETHAHTHPLYRLFKIELLDSTGTLIKRWNQDHRQRPPLIEIPTDSGTRQASLLRLQAHASSYRTIFQLQSIPGLPSSNQSITNLVDAIIPSLQVDNIFELRHVIAKLTTLTELQPPPHRPNLSFPMSFRNITVAELMKAYQSLYPPDHHLIIDKNSRTFSVQRTPPTGVLFRLKKDLQHLFNRN